MAIKPPRPPSPPMTALRAFEAAARLGGFTRAADELCVTPGAVAQQVKQLEAWAGAALFERRAQGVVLTEAGVMALPSLTQAFDQMGAAVRVLNEATSPNRVHIAALPAIAQLWLSPRLPAIRAALPELVLSVTAMEHPPNMAREPYDLAIFFSEFGTPIMPDALFPVCAPALAPQLQSLADLEHITCLTDAAWPDDWQDWLTYMGAGEVTPRGPTHSLYALALEDTLNGAGVLMGHEALVAPYLASGALAAPFLGRLPLSRPLAILRSPGSASPTLGQLTALLSGESGL